jgi:hypothetical protein
MPDTDPPVLEVSDTVYDDGSSVIEVISSEPGMVYLVPGNTPGVISQIRETALDSLAALSGTSLLFPLTGLDNGTYRVYAVDTVMNLSAPHPVVILGVAVASRVIGTMGNYPNPFSEVTTLWFEVEESQQLQLGVYDSQGRQVRLVPLGIFAPGEHQVTFRRGGLPEGIYLYRIENRGGKGKTGRWIIRE